MELREPGGHFEIKSTRRVLLLVVKPQTEKPDFNPLLFAGPCIVGAVGAAARSHGGGDKLREAHATQLKLLLLSESQNLLLLLDAEHLSAWASTQTAVTCVVSSHVTGPVAAGRWTSEFLKNIKN